MPAREEVKQRLAEVSHATWMLQGIRDSERTFEELFVAEPKPPKDQAQVDEAERRLAAVRDDGRSLDEFSEAEAQRVMRHDLERAEESVKALETMGFVFD
jgi:hypothetical protein